MEKKDSSQTHLQKTFKRGAAMRGFSFWQKWLFVVSLIICCFGLLMAFWGGAVLFQVFNDQVDKVFWGSAQVPNQAANFRQWIYGVLGATMAGWGVFLAFIVQYPFKRKEKWAWNCLLSGLGIWFVVDTFISIYHTVYFNAFFNIVLMIALIVPLIFTRIHFR